MRALFCLKGPNEVNGPNVWLTRHLPLLAQRGVTPWVLYVAEDVHEPCRFLGALQASGIGVTRVALGRFTDDDVPAILAGIAEARPDVFVPNYTPAAYYACRFAREAGIRTVGTLHSDDPYYHDIIDVFLRGDDAWRLDAAVTVSDYLQAVAVEAAAPGTMVLQATYGAPLTSAVAGEGDDSLTLVYVGRLVERQKRILRVAERLCAAAAAVPGVHARLYGDGRERQAVQSIIEARGAASRVSLGGTLSPDEMQPTMLQAHALVLLSDFEGLSIALMEAMACGLVPIVSDLRSGTGDLIRHDENALVVDPTSDQDFVQAVRRLRFESGLRERLGRAARETIVAKGYTSEACADKWAWLCRELGAQEQRRPVRIPEAHALNLPLPCTTPFGLRIGDRRDPRARLEVMSGASRPIYVWGASTGGRQFLNTQTGRQMPIAGVIDRRAVDGAFTFQELTVLPPDVLRARASDEPKPFVVIASMYEEEISRELEDYGFRSLEDFVAV